MLEDRSVDQHCRWYYQHSEGTSIMGPYLVIVVGKTMPELTTRYDEQGSNFVIVAERKYDSKQRYFEVPICEFNFGTTTKGKYSASNQEERNKFDHLYGKISDEAIKWLTPHIFEHLRKILDQKGIEESFSYIRYRVKKKTGELSTKVKSGVKRVLRINIGLENSPLIQLMDNLVAKTNLERQIGLSFRLDGFIGRIKRLVDKYKNPLRTKTPPRGFRSAIYLLSQPRNRKFIKNISCLRKICWAMKYPIFLIEALRRENLINSNTYYQLFVGDNQEIASIPSWMSVDCPYPEFLNLEVEKLREQKGYQPYDIIRRT